MTTTYSDPSAQKFFDMIDRVTAEAVASPAGKILVAAGFGTQHTGGGCMAWELNDEHGEWFCYITDDSGVDLGTDVPDPENANWIAGLYDVNWDKECVNLFFPKLSDAIAWCKEALRAPEETQIATRWVEKLGLGFHPDTAGRDIIPALEPYQIIDYERDMERLHEISADPYLAGLRAMRIALPDCFADPLVDAARALLAKWDTGKNLSAEIQALATALQTR